MIRDYLTVTGAIDPVALERARMHQVSSGIVPRARGRPLTAVAYVALQELATRIAHRNTGRLLGRPGLDVMARVASDENLHYLFYRTWWPPPSSWTLDRPCGPSNGRSRDFEMPGTGIMGFDPHAVAIANAGIYDLRQHQDQVLEPVLRQWKVWDIEGLGPEGEKARQEIGDFLETLEVAAAASRSARRLGQHARQPAPDPAGAGHDHGARFRALRTRFTGDSRFHSSARATSPAGSAGAVGTCGSQP